MKQVPDGRGGRDVAVKTQEDPKKLTNTYTHITKGLSTSSVSKPKKSWHAAQPSGVVLWVCLAQMSDGWPRSVQACHSPSLGLIPSWSPLEEDSVCVRCDFSCLLAYHEPTECCSLPLEKPKRQETCPTYCLSQNG